ncbi:MAG: hypothetical protein SVT56_11155, partial [Chloroflexota bacterium]|nr:hypothetical protein [Chloroflexota bacterium]
LESWLMFTKDDFQIVIEYDEEGVDYDLYKFITTVKQAKHRLDTKGITIGFCKELYEEFRTSILYRDYDLEKRKSNYIPNEIDGANGSKRLALS